MTCWAIIVAAGGGKRAAAETPKQFVAINGRAALWHAVRPFLRADFIDKIRIVVTAEAAATAKKSVGDCLPQIEILTAGGATRAESVCGGLQGLDNDDWAMIHDAARPCLRDEVLARFWRLAAKDKIGGLLAMRVGDALKIGCEGRARQTIARDDKFLAQTPQMFRAGMLRAALANAADKHVDESQAMEAAGFSPLLIQGDSANIKITYPEDFALAAALLSAQNHAETLSAQNHAKTLSAQNHAKTLSAQNHAKTLSAQNHAKTLSAQNHAKTLPAQNHAETLPAQNHAAGADTKP